MFCRWVKYEEDVEGADRHWGRAHVPFLSFHSLLQLRKCIDKGEQKVKITYNYIITQMWNNNVVLKLTLGFLSYFLFGHLLKYDKNFRQNQIMKAKFSAISGFWTLLIWKFPGVILLDVAPCGFVEVCWLIANNMGTAYSLEQHLVTAIFNSLMHNHQFANWDFFVLSLKKIF